MPHYSSSKEYKFVSRAEFKLLEAIECFGLDLSNMKIGADLGSAPGGWTKVLVDNDIKCVSIDPSYLRDEISKNPKVIYYHMKVEEYLLLNDKTQFDIVVNDMKMDVLKSISIVNQFYNKIKDNGIVVITFKLPHEFSYCDLHKCFSAFNGYTIIGVRQLFHNRSEITVILKKDKNQDVSKYSHKTIINKKNKHGKKKSMSKKLQRKMSKKLK